MGPKLRAFRVSGYVAVPFSEVVMARGPQAVKRVIRETRINRAVGCTEAYLNGWKATLVIEEAAK
jgi:hypothetical protein